jgi:hypothetical protein
MQEDEWQRMVALSSLVDEMKPEAIHMGMKMGKRVVMSQYAQKLANYAQQMNMEGVEPE